ncbi:hypothetical protein [Halobacillus sp. BBL2006]|uniref:hypothetical protein n=1 Tax=Halobacillus sp. BBL2006 TaxID=1543706 RepID=UPI000541DEC0|nr:hypothetical protein [Halobacillus sp. BBL2006]KHE67108.1 hypothetical protein LD39_19220 [Halobacillus sp. BBL2006]
MLFKQTGIEWIFQILLIAIGVFFLFYGFKYTPEKHQKAREQSEVDLRTKKDFQYKWLAKFIMKTPWWSGRIFFIIIGVFIVFLAVIGKGLFQ